MLKSLCIINYEMGDCMKELYIIPELETILLNGEDIVTTSDEDDCPRELPF